MNWAELQNLRRTHESTKNIDTNPKLTHSTIPTIPSFHSNNPIKLHAASITRIENIKRVNNFRSELRNLELQDQVNTLNTASTPKEFRDMKADKNTVIHAVPNAQIVGDKPYVGLTVKDKEIILNSARGHMDPYQLVRRINDRLLGIILDDKVDETLTTNATNVQGEHISLVGNGADNFWHWIVEYLPKVALAESAGFDGQYIVPGNRGFVDASFDMLGIDPSRRTKFTGGVWNVERLYVPSFLPAWPDEMKRDESKLSSHCHFLRKVREQLLDAAYGERTDAKEELPNKIFVQRRDTARKQLCINSDEVEGFLEARGYVPCYFEDYSLSQQIRITSSVDRFFGLHGAAFTHALFMKQESVITEIYSTHYDVDFYQVVNNANPNTFHHCIVKTDVYDFQKEIQVIAERRKGERQPHSTIAPDFEELLQPENIYVNIQELDKQMHFDTVTHT